MTAWLITHSKPQRVGRRLFHELKAGMNGTGLLGTGQGAQGKETHYKEI